MYIFLFFALIKNFIKSTYTLIGRSSFTYVCGQFNNLNVWNLHLFERKREWSLRVCVVLRSKKLFVSLNITRVVSSLSKYVARAPHPYILLIHNIPTCPENPAICVYFSCVCVHCLGGKHLSNSFLVDFEELKKPFLESRKLKSNLGSIDFNKVISAQVFF